MIPITRKELYLNKIVGNNDYETPEKPIPTEEFFFAEILGEAVQAPEPLPRYQIYLAKIAGRNIEIPYPETRLEYFLARAAGMDIETPVPITKEEIYWSNYTAIVELEVEGVPPLTYKAMEGTLKNYRIYGQTVDGESVGDRTGNLFDKNKITENKYVYNGSFNNSTVSDISEYISISNGLTYTLSWNVSRLSSSNPRQIGIYDNQKHYLGIIQYEVSGRFSTSFTVDIMDAAYIVVTIDKGFQNIMLNTGSEPLPYEPYGYKVPVTISNSTDTLTTPIYLPEQIRKVGDEAEYIDYGTQKQHRVRRNLFNGYKTTDIINNSYIDKATGNIISADDYYISYPIAVIENQNYVWTFNTFRDNYTCKHAAPTVGFYDVNNVLISTAMHDNNISSFMFTVPDNCSYIRASVYKLNSVNKTEAMLNSGSEPLPYEPYIENTDLDVTLPALPTLAGTNVLSVGTEVQPSKVYVKYKGERQ